MADEKEAPSLAPDDWYQKLLVAIQKPVVIPSPSVTASEVVELRRPFWMPDTKGFLAIAMVGMLVLLLVLLVWGKLPSDNGPVITLLTTIVGAMLIQMKEVYGYFFGSSASSSSKDESIQKMATAATTAATVATTAAVEKNGAPHA